jgi:CHAD domain-containing protein
MILVINTQEKPAAELRRITHKRLERLLETLKARDMGSDNSVHDARKQIKELRGVLQLARPQLGKKICRRENRALRDAARPLSQLRDAKVLIATLDKLVSGSRSRLKPAHLSRLRVTLQQRRLQVHNEVLYKDRLLPDLIRCVEDAAHRIKQWPHHELGWKAVRDGLLRIYQRARSAMQEAQAARSNETLHQWRKRTKALRYALDVLRSKEPKRMRRLSTQARRLTNLLGQDHDLALLAEAVQQQSALQSVADTAPLTSLIVKRRLTLQRRATDIGNRLFRSKGRPFVRRLIGHR